MKWFFLVLASFQMMASGLSCSKGSVPAGKKVPQVSISGSKPNILLGSRKLENMDTIFKGLGPSQTVTVEVVVPAKKADTMLFALPVVRAGSLAIKTETGFLVYLPSNEISVVTAHPPKAEFLRQLGNHRLMIDFYFPEQPGILSATTELNAVEDARGNKVDKSLRRQPLPYVLKGNKAIVTLTVTTSKDFDGQLQGWMIPMRK